MARIARRAARVAQIQQDNLLDVHNFVERNRIRLMEMEWVDGYDLSRLLTHEMLERPRAGQQPALGLSQQRHRDRRPAAAAAEAGHGDRGAARMPGGPGGAASRGDRPRRHQAVEHHAQADRQRQDHRHRLGIRMDKPPARRSCTPTYAAPEVLEGGECIAALGLGQPGLRADRDALRRAALSPARPRIAELLEAKRNLVQKLHERLPQEVVCNELLMNLIRGLIAPDPMLPLPQRRGGRPGQGRRRQLPPPTGQRRPGQRIRKRNSPVAGEVGLGVC